MPYNPDSDEYYWGKTFNRDGSDYDPNVPRPKLSDAVRVLRRTGSTVFGMVISGKLYKGGTPISGYGKTIDLTSLENAARGVETNEQREQRTAQEKIGGTYKPGSRVSGGRSLEQKLFELLDLSEVPIHVTGIYFQPLN